MRIRATSLAGNGSFTETVHFFMPNRKTLHDLSHFTDLSCNKGSCNSDHIEGYKPVRAVVRDSVLFIGKI